MQFFNVKSAAEVRELLEGGTLALATDTVPITTAVGRVLAEDVAAPIDLPEFDRAVVDGYAVRAADTFGAGAGAPAYLRVAGEILMGEAARGRVATGECMKIATGGMLPEGADAVVMVEYTDTVDGELIEVTRPVAPGDSLVRRGDDVGRGAVVAPRGRRLRPQDLGVCSALGVLEVAVFRRPRVAVMPTGDEIVPPQETPAPGQVRDVNTVAVSAAVQEQGGAPRAYPIVRDDPDALKAAVSHALANSDLILVAGGSSVGTRDWTLDVLLTFKDAELLVHGVAIRPGKPVILVRIGERLVFGLPGNPVSALVVFDQFVAPYLRRLSGECVGVVENRTVRATLASSYRSDAGKEDYVRVRLEQAPGGYRAHPILGKSTLIMTMVQGDGMVVVPANLEGIEAGTEVEVQLF